MIFGKAFRGIADGADQLAAEVRLAADPIVQHAGDRITEKAVDGEIPAAGVGLGVRKGDRRWMPSIAVTSLGAKRGDLKFLSFRTTMMTPNFLPTGSVCSKSASICGGVAEVAIS